MTYEHLCKHAVTWYRQNGLYLDRIREDGYGILYVIGDESWNVNHPNKQEAVDNFLPRGL